MACLALAATALSGCARYDTAFFEANARRHVEVLAGSIGSRPAGTPTNARARAYVVDALEEYGFDVRVEETDAVQPEYGRTVRVANVIARRTGSRPGAIALLSHYDSTPMSPGAADNGFGVAVCLEAARVLGARGGARHSLVVLVTDGEEEGLMGAEALARDADFVRSLRAVINVESMGPAGPSLLFEAGPASGHLVDAWRRVAPWPRGTSYAAEIYRRLPNDTDFTVFKRQGVPGLNFAPIGNSAVYHTSRDTADRMSAWTLRQSGANLVALVEALDAMDLDRPSGGDRVFFDVLNVIAFSYGPTGRLALMAASLLMAIAAWFRLVRSARRRVGTIRLATTLVWSIAGSAAVAASMVGVTWMLRAVRESYHPWYAHPDRFLALLAAAAACVTWILIRAGRRLPHRLRGSLDPAVVWSVALPAWAAIALAVDRLAPAASYMWFVPLLSASVPLALTSPRSDRVLRLSSAIALALVSAVWVRDCYALFHFLVEQMARLPFVTPVFVYAALLVVTGLMIAPPLLAAFGANPHPAAARAFGPLAAAAVVAATWMAYVAPAYSFDRPLRRSVRYVSNGLTGQAFWEVGSLEPGLDLELARGAPSGWQRAVRGDLADLAVVRLRQPFLFRAPDTARPFPATLEVSATPTAGTVNVALIVQAPAGSELAFLIPAGLPIHDASLAGASDGRYWVASLGGSAGGTLRFGLDQSHVPRLREAAVAVTLPGLPGGAGWQALPGWLPQDRAVWSAAAVFVEPVGDRVAAGGLAERPSLR